MVSIMNWIWFLMPFRRWKKCMKYAWTQVFKLFHWSLWLMILLIMESGISLIEQIFWEPLPPVWSPSSPTWSVAVARHLPETLPCSDQIPLPTKICVVEISSQSDKHCLSWCWLIQNLWVCSSGWLITSKGHKATTTNTLSVLPLVCPPLDPYPFGCPISKVRITLPCHMWSRQDPYWTDLSDLNYCIRVGSLTHSFGYRYCW